METILSRISDSFYKKNLGCRSKNNAGGYYRMIYVIIKKAIISNDIPKQSILPATRLLARTIGVSRSTIVKSYELLAYEGYIKSVVGSGHIVIWIQPKAKLSKSVDSNKFSYPELSENGKSFYKNASSFKPTKEGGIAFSPGIPPLDIFPVNQWKTLTNLYWRHIKSSALSFSASSGTAQLKETLANYLNFSRNIICEPEQIIVVSGSMQSLYIIGNAIINPGDTIFIENPTFPDTLSIFRGLRANIVPINIDKQGINVKEMREYNDTYPKLVHTAPSSHYPTGVRMSLERRLELLKWASDNESFIIEEDYEHEVNNYKDSIQSIFRLDTEQRTIFLGSFNRLLHPSIRIGYMVVPLHLLDTFRALIRHSHRFVPSSIQVVLSQFIERKYLYNHIKNVIEIAEERKEIFSKIFEESFGESLILNPSQTRSLHVMAELQDGMDDLKMAKFFANYNITTHAFSKCFNGEIKKQGLIFGYSPINPPIIKKKVILMEKLYREFSK